MISVGEKGDRQLGPAKIFPALQTMNLSCIDIALQKSLFSHMDAKTLSSV